MSAVLLTAPAAEPLSLADAKAFLRVEHDDDAIITSLVASARNHVEALTRCGLITQSWRLVLMMAGPQRPQLPISKQVESSIGKAVVPATIPAGTASTGAVIAAGAATAASTGRAEIALLVVTAAALAAAAIFLIWRWRHRAQQESAIEGTTNGLG